MKMRCNNCGREMHLSELIGYAEAYLLKAIAPVGVLFLVQAIEHYLLTPKKGFIDDQMASFASTFKISCPKCKNVDCWDPAPEKPAEPMNNQIQK